MTSKPEVPEVQFVALSTFRKEEELPPAPAGDAPQTPARRDQLLPAPSGDAPQPPVTEIIAPGARMPPPANFDVVLGDADETTRMNAAWSGGPGGDSMLPTELDE
eukprot:800926-Heterocapsa_arctica.AAC.1